jgi:CheY-like chemotaxis protein
MGRGKRKPVRQPAKSVAARSRVARVGAHDRGTAAIEAALAALAHEVRTPLNGILAFGELLAASQLPERERGWAAGIKSAAEHLAQLTGVIVDGAKADRRKLVLRSDPFCPRALVDAIVASLHARAEAKGLAVAVSVDDELPTRVTGDVARLRAALENLIDNAVKFTERGEVRFDVGARRNSSHRGGTAARNRIHLVFTVADSGIGLSGAERKRLMRPFAQASAGVARRFGGAGLGLVFVKRIAEAMGGGLTIESAPGRGSRFTLAIELELSHGTADGKGETTQAPAAAAEGRVLRILCAEDNPYGRVVLNTILTELGHRVDFVDSGTAAVDALSRGGYDLVLMDVTLPELDGLAATRRIRASTAGAQVPIVGISGRAEVTDRTAALAAGMNAYLGKPVSPAAIASLLEELVGAPR